MQEKDNYLRDYQIIFMDIMYLKVLNNFMVTSFLTRKIETHIKFWWLLSFSWWLELFTFSSEGCRIVSFSRLTSSMHCIICYMVFLLEWSWNQVLQRPYDGRQLLHSKRYYWPSIVVILSPVYFSTLEPTK